MQCDPEDEVQDGEIEKLSLSTETPQISLS